MADDGDMRIGTQERDEALAALAVHRDAGRLDAFEYEDRRGKAVDAVTKRDLTSLFAEPVLTTKAAFGRRPSRGDARRRRNSSGSARKRDHGKRA